MQATRPARSAVSLAATMQGVADNLVERFILSRLQHLANAEKVVDQVAVQLLSESGKLADLGGNRFPIGLGRGQQIGQDVGLRADGLAELSVPLAQSLSRGPKPGALLLGEIEIPQHSQPVPWPARPVN